MGAQQSHAPAHVPDPPTGTPFGTIPTLHGHGLSSFASGGIIGHVTGNSTLAHLTPPNPSESMHNLTQAFATEFAHGSSAAANAISNNPEVLASLATIRRDVESRLQAR